MTVISPHIDLQACQAGKIKPHRIEGKIDIETHAMDPNHVQD